MDGKNKQEKEEEKRGEASLSSTFSSATQLVVLPFSTDKCDSHLLKICLVLELSSYLFAYIFECDIYKPKEFISFLNINLIPLVNMEKTLHAFPEN